MANTIVPVQQLTNPGTGTFVSATQRNPEARGIVLFINITAVSGGATLTVTLQGVEPASGLTYTLLASTALASAAMTTMIVYPGLTAAANTVATNILPPSWRVSSAVAVAGTITATITAGLVE